MGFPEFIYCACFNAVTIFFFEAFGKILLSINLGIGYVKIDIKNEQKWVIDGR